MTRLYKALLLLALTSIANISWAQSLATPKSALKPCAVTERGEWIDAYQRGEIAAVRSTETLILPLRIHIVGNSQGDGYTPLNTLLSAMQLLNEDFATANVVFYIDGEIHYINNSTYYDHSFSQGATMMAFNNDPAVVNCYFVGNPAGACGYYSPSRDALAIGNNCIGGGDHTWAHEMGHFLSLPHTFSGWEGYYDNAQFENAPRDERAPGFVGGRAVEKADSSNCATAGDGFCDTPADYLSERWPCNSAGIYRDSMLDQDSNRLVMYAYPIMGYALDNCVESFTDEQRTAMITNVNSRGNLSRNIPIESAASVDDVELVAPPSGGTMTLVDEYRVDLEWTAAENATFYIIQLSRNQFFSGVQEFISYENTYSLTPAQNDIALNVRYYWRVRPVNRFDVEGDYSGNRNFRVTEIVSSTIDPELNNAISVYPNPVSSDNIYVNANGLSNNADLSIELINTTGQVLRQLNNVAIANGSMNQAVSVADISNGVYFLRIRQNDRLLTRRLVISK